jgi:hypothetical protein
LKSAQQGDTLIYGRRRLFPLNDSQQLFYSQLVPTSKHVAKPVALKKMIKIFSSRATVFAKIRFRCVYDREV